MASRRLRELSAPWRMRSAAVDEVRSMRLLLRRLKRMKADQPHISHLLVTRSRSAGPLWIPSTEERRQQVKASKEWQVTYTALISWVAPGLEALCLALDVHSQTTKFPQLAPYCVDFPLLQDLTVSATCLFDYFGRRSPDQSNMPCLRRLHLMDYQPSRWYPYHCYLPKIAPGLRLLRLNGPRLLVDGDLDLALGSLVGDPESRLRAHQLLIQTQSTWDFIIYRVTSGISIWTDVPPELLRYLQAVILDPTGFVSPPFDHQSIDIGAWHSRVKKIAGCVANKVEIAALSQYRKPYDQPYDLGDVKNDWYAVVQENCRG
jgi:hypothetical protein